jgi:hypothetical protein
MHETRVEALENRPLRLASCPKCRREAVLSLQRPVSSGARLFEELVAEVSEAMPIGRADELAALKPDARGLRHADSDLDRFAVDVL